MRYRAIVHRLLISLLLIVALSSVVAGMPITLVLAQDELALEPANPHASQDARRVLNYLARLPGRGGERVIVGQHLSGGRSAASGYDRFVNPLHQATGEWVAMVGGEYGRDHTLAEIAAENQSLIDHWNAGGLVTITYHANNPWTGGECLGFDLP